MTRLLWVMVWFMLIAPFVFYGLERAGIGIHVSELIMSGSGLETTAPSYEIPRSRSGEFFAQASLNGQPVTMLVDTGAATIALTSSLASQIGIDLTNADFDRQVWTSNGKEEAAMATVETVGLGPISLKNVEAIVLKDGVLQVPLLGMSALGKLEEVDILDDTMILVQ
ncbi:TIGR02281 family clan AA aspartic protease [Roseibium sp. RKSG952]|uniref:retropepsin-like aspartic protease family protein n=1 Tax=Roseibium sp. RKSG952 TaxID=2529384 RepID=UPI0012BCA656|nr:TIGR02281 family clan AA aspartic protease [Roseibium sp. RKSG952]MTH97495.1 TIGR02281 family clan AA aspartic protease [Roseibium sp. RKSG952]